MNFSVYKELLFVLFFVLFGLVVTLWLYPGFSSIGTDGVIYALVGQNIAEGNGISIYGEPHTIFGPLLPIFIALFYLMIGNIELAAHAATIFFGLVSIPLFYILIREMFSRDVALVSLPLFALSAQFIWPYITVPTPQVVAGFFAMLTMLALFKVSSAAKALSRKNLIWFFIVGLSIGLSYLARPEYFLLIFPVFIYIFWIYRKNFSYRSILKYLAIILIGFTVVALPYVVFLHDALGHWTISGKIGGVVSHLITGQYPETGDSFVQEVSLLQEVGDNALSKAAESVPANLKEFFKSLRDAERSLVKTLGFIGIIFFAFGIRKLLMDKKFRILWIMIISISLLPLVIYIVDNIPNYLSQYLFIFIALAGLGLSHFLHELKGWFRMSDTKYRTVSFLLIAITSLYFFFPIIQVYLFLPEDNQPKELKELGLWAKNNIPGIDEEAVLSRKPNVSFYSESKFVSFPDIADEEALAEYMRQNEIKYLVIDNRYMPSDRGQFSYLIYEPSQNFQLVHKETFHNKQAILYELKEANK